MFVHDGPKNFDHSAVCGNGPKCLFYSFVNVIVFAQIFSNDEVETLFP